MPRTRCFPPRGVLRVPTKASTKRGDRARRACTVAGLQSGFLTRRRRSAKHTSGGPRLAAIRRCAPTMYARRNSSMTSSTRADRDRAVGEIERRPVRHARGSRGSRSRGPYASRSITLPSAPPRISAGAIAEHFFARRGARAGKQNHQRGDQPSAVKAQRCQPPAIAES